MNKIKYFNEWQFMKAVASFTRMGIYFDVDEGVSDTDYILTTRPYYIDKSSGKTIKHIFENHTVVARMSLHKLEEDRELVCVLTDYMSDAFIRRMFFGEGSWWDETRREELSGD